MESWLKLNNQMAGRDKLARLVQYASRALSDTLERSQANPSMADTFKTLEYILSTFRKLLRFGRCFDVFYSALKTMHYDDVVVRITLTMGKLSQSLFLFADHFMWLARTGLVKDINVKKWTQLSNKYWLLSIIMNLCRDVYEILRLLRLHKASRKSGISRPARIETIRDLGPAFLHSYALMLAHKDVVVDTVKNTCDFFIPFTALGYTKMTPRMIGVLGVISSVAGLIALVKPDAKLSLGDCFFMEAQYAPIGGGRDMHNRCCGGRAWCVKDICGIFCAIFTWLLIIFAEFVVMRVILLPSQHSEAGFDVFNMLNIVIFNTLAFLAISSHIRTMLSDPGAVPRGNATKEQIEQMGYREGEMFFKCPKCCSIKPERAHHCSVCQRCIRKMDHHCPWVNNCVGENNQKYFVLFTFYIAGISCHAIFLVVTEFADCIKSEWRQCSPYSPPATIFLLLFLTFEALMFAIFTIIMLATQLTAILNDQTGIEQLKKEEARWAKKSRIKSIQSVFGRFSLAWFSPFTKPSCKTKFNSHFYSV